MGEHEARHKVGILALQRGAAETDRRLRHIEIGDFETAEAGERGLRNGRKLRRRRQIGEEFVHQSRRAVRTDRADDRHNQPAAGNPLARRARQVLARQRRKRFNFAFAWTAVGVGAEHAFAPRLGGHMRGLFGVMTQSGVHLFAHALEGLFIEARRIDREPREFAGAVEIARQRAQAASDEIAFGVKRNLDRLLVEGALVGLAVEVARAFIEQPCEHRRRARLAFGIARRAAAKGEFDRDDRHGVILDEPGAYAARRDDFAHVDGAAAGK